MDFRSFLIIFIPFCLYYTYPPFCGFLDCYKKSTNMNFPAFYHVACDDDDSP